MQKEDIDVIIVGAGLAGSAAAIKLAQAGVKVVLIDRGTPIGSKNISGGVLWGDDLSEIIPNWIEEAPVERKIINKKIGFLSDEDATIIDFHFNSWNEDPIQGVSVLRVKFDEWLANKAKEIGVAVLPGINIDELIFDNNRIVGVRQGEEELFAHVVIIAEGANPRLLLKHHLTYVGEQESYNPKDMMLGIKETIKIDQGSLEERFLIDSKQGLAGEFVLGNLPNNVLAGGFFYTNKDTISIGVVIHLDSLSSEDRSYHIMEYYKNHPFIAKLIKNGEIIEYGAKLVPEFGIKNLPKLFGDGFLVVGDAAGFVFSNGMVIQGMNYAIKSGILAADAVIEAKMVNDFTSEALSVYLAKLENSYVLKDLKKFRKVKAITKNPNIFHGYPSFINNSFKEILSEQGSPKEKIIPTFIKNFRKSSIGLFSLIKDGLGVRHL